MFYHGEHDPNRGRPRTLAVSKCFGVRLMAWSLPDEKVSGGKVLHTGWRKVKNRIAMALRLGAQCLYHAKNYLGEYYRKMKWRLEAPQALTATAHKLARIVFHMLVTKEPCNESVLVKWDQQVSMKSELRLRSQAAKLGFDLIPTAEPQP